VPYVNVKMYPGRSDEQKREVSRRIVQALMEVCNVNDPAACAVVIEELSPEEYRETAVPEIEAKAAQRYDS
jgi:4-oxalocrotonate tautomerase